MSRKIKFAIILLSAVFLAWLIGQPLSEIGRQRTYDDPPSAGQKLSAAELNEFLDLWSRMLHGKLHRYVGQISLSSGKSYPGPLVKWLKLQGWDVERFFYDEQRLRELIDCVALVENISGNVAMSQHSTVNLSQIISEQRLRLKSCRFDQDELDLIKSNLYQITEVFSGRAVFAAPEK